MLTHLTAFICQVRDSLWLTLNNRAEAGAGSEGLKGLKVSLGDSNETILSRIEMWHDMGNFDTQGLWSLLF